MTTIFIVDDNPAIREIFTFYLNLEGYTTIAVDGGKECLALLKTCVPDLILLDLMMEPMDGWETLCQIRQRPGTGRIPVIIITAKHPSPEEIRHYGGWIEDFIEKPVDFDQVVALLPPVLEKARDLDQEMTRQIAEGTDPALVTEYSCLLRLVQLTRTLMKRFADIPWGSRKPLLVLEERLGLLHARLGIPDRFLERDDGDRVGTGR